MKKDDWLLYLIIASTSTTTIATMWDGTLFGLFKGLICAGILDGLIMFWEKRAEEMKDDTQRKFANIMKWAGISMLLIVAVAYVFTSVVPVDTKKTFDVFGLIFTTTIRSAIHWSIVGLISLWTVLTLAVVVRVREIDPDTKMKLEYTKAEQRRQQKKLDAYNIANDFTADELGKLEALENYRDDLRRTKRYTEGEIEGMVMAASQEIDRRKLIPVNIKSQPVNAYNQTAQGVDAVNPTTASPRKS